MARIRPFRPALEGAIDPPCARGGRGGWGGLLVEPLRDYFDQLRRTCVKPPAEDAPALGGDVIEGDMTVGMWLKGRD